MNDEKKSGKYWADLSGKSLPDHLVKAAREKERDTLDTFKVYQKVPIQECWDKTGKGPLMLR